ncbi:DUF4159 domain-containing protein [Aerosakkonemataceae cyanobacterium BLCC-F50]|uniref:DUF4159 domain-containing protein n=1 Tax=Floridaenema flaviceps BLCC-F50 TaxID=3153642 RepID=A0ABV4XMX0_9CYAN
MNDKFFSLPRIEPFERLHVYDSLMMNAKRWLMAHEYHRRRQNVHYQSLNQPGIVCGLGVKLIEPPEEAPAQFRDKRWLEIQPGIAIDIEGNPIIVNPSVNRKFRIATAPPTTGTLTVYLVVSFVEPENPERKQDIEVLREWFRFDEKTSPPKEKEIELCRIELQPGTVKLQKPKDVLFPEVNDIDLRCRLLAKARPEAVVNAGLMKYNDADDWYNSDMQKLSDRDRENLSYLMRSISSLYPALQGIAEIGQVSLQNKRAIADYDLFFLADWQVVNLNEEELHTLSIYLKTGGIILIETPTNNSFLIDNIHKIITDKLDIDLLSWQEMSRYHPLRTQPFLFAIPPNINQQSIEIQSGGGIILVIGNLLSAWGIDEEVSLDRNDIRSAQELGINILHFAWCRRQMTQLLQ